MKILKKFACIMLLLIKGIAYKFGRRQIPFWHWLYERIKRKDKYSFAEGCYIKFLFINACNNDFSEGICNIYENFRPGISDKELPSKDLVKVFDASIETSNQEVAGRVIKIAERTPNYFSSSFKNECNKVYQSTFNS